MPAAGPRVYNPKEYKLVALREFPERDNALADTPDSAAAYYRAHIPQSTGFRADVENFCVLLINTRRRIKGHLVISNGTLDTLLVHPREVFRPAFIAAAAAIILIHNHPSGDPAPSEGDIKVTRELIRAGTLLKIDVLDHLIFGQATTQNPKDYVSLREIGYFAI